MMSKMINKFLISVIGVILFAPFGMCKNIYVAQNAAGASNGADCADARPVAWFNSSSSWGTASTQISPGDTVHLCGTFTGAPGSAMLAVQGSGAVGQPITILFESGARLTAPYWGYATGAISCYNHSNITIDGGSNGRIENTDDGTALSYQVNTKAVDGGGPGCTNFTVRNLTISNLYIRTEGSTTDSIDTAGIVLYGNNALATHNTIDHSRIGIVMAYSTSSNVEISFNTETFVEHGITISDGNPGNTLVGARIHDNDIGGGAYLWDSGLSNMWHHDPIHIFAVHTGSSTADVQVYNNQIHGVWGRDTVFGKSHVTAGIFIENAGGMQIYNNVISWSGSLNMPSNGFIYLKEAGANNTRIYNNTLISDNEAQGIGLGGATGVDVRNNIMFRLPYAIYAPPGSSVATSDYNDFYGVANSGANYISFAQWKALGYDTHTITTDPKLDVTGRVLAGSPTIGIGANFTGLGVTPLNSDIISVRRPATGLWDLGAYVYGGTQTQAPAAPTGLSAIVQ